MKWLKNLFKSKPKCPRCSSPNLEYSYKWIRGYDNYCTQVCGSSGTRCFECGHIIWDLSLEDYQDSLPKWCVAYPDRPNSSIKQNNSKNNI